LCWVWCGQAQSAAAERFHLARVEHIQEASGHNAGASPHLRSAYALAKQQPSEESGPERFGGEEEAAVGSSR